MKKNYVVRIAALVVMCALVTACFASSTFAKYTTSTSDMSDTVTVAKWDVTLDGTALPSATKSVFGTTEKIAPGSTGSFDFAIANNSDVSAKIVLTFTVSGTAKDVLTISAEEGTTVSKSGDTYTVTYDKVTAGASKTPAFTWEWDYDADDTGDTTLGSYGTGTAPTAIITASITASQYGEGVQ